MSTVPIRSLVILLPPAARQRNITCEMTSHRMFARCWISSSSTPLLRPSPPTVVTIMWRLITHKPRTSRHNFHSALHCSTGTCWLYWLVMCSQSWTLRSSRALTMSTSIEFPIKAEECEQKQLRFDIDARESDSERERWKRISSGREWIEREKVEEIRSVKFGFHAETDPTVHSLPGSWFCLRFFAQWRFYVAQWVAHFDLLDFVSTIHIIWVGTQNADSVSFPAKGLGRMHSNRC